MANLIGRQNVYSCMTQLDWTLSYILPLKTSCDPSIAVSLTVMFVYHIYRWLHKRDCSLRIKFTSHAPSPWPTISEFWKVFLFSLLEKIYTSGGSGRMGGGSSRTLFPLSSDFITLKLSCNNNIYRQLSCIMKKCNTLRVCGIPYRWVFIQCFVGNHAI